MKVYIKNISSLLMLFPIFNIQNLNNGLLYSNLQLVIISYMNHLINFNDNDIVKLKELDYLAISWIQLLSITNSYSYSFLLCILQIYNVQLRYLYIIVNYLELICKYKYKILLLLVPQSVGFQYNNNYWSMKKKFIWHIGCALNVYYSLLNSNL